MLGQTGSKSKSTKPRTNGEKNSSASKSSEPIQFNRANFSTLGPSWEDDLEARIEAREFNALIGTYSNWIRLQKEPENPTLNISSVPPVVIYSLNSLRKAMRVSTENALSLCVIFGFERLREHPAIQTICDLRDRFTDIPSDGSALWRTICDTLEEDAKIGMEKGSQWNPPMNAQFFHTLYIPVRKNLGIEKTSFALACILAYLATQEAVAEKTRAEFREILTGFFFKLETKAAKISNLISTYEKAQKRGTPGDYDPLADVPRSECLENSDLLSFRDNPDSVCTRIEEHKKEISKLEKKLPKWLRDSQHPETVQ